MLVVFQFGPWSITLCWLFFSSVLVHHSMLVVFQFGPWSITLCWLFFSEEIRSMIPQELLHANDMLNSVDGCAQSTPTLQGVSERWLAYPKLVS